MTLTSKGACVINTISSRMKPDMPQALVSLAVKDYPGRLIILGQEASGTKVIVVYGITGRSPSSQARHMVARKGGIWVEPTDETILQRGNPDLLIYPAVQFGHGIAVSNGQQTADVKKCLPESGNPIDILESSLSHWDYEPDEPAFTPRISGCVLPNMKAALSIIRRTKDGTAVRDYFAIELGPGKGSLISTYAGQNIDPLPSFTGTPETVFFTRNTPQEIARDVYRALGPGKDRTKDFRVSVACVIARPGDPSPPESAIINRSERIDDEEN